MNKRTRLLVGFACLILGLYTLFAFANGTFFPWEWLSKDRGAWVFINVFIMLGASFVFGLMGSGQDKVR